MCHNSGSVEIWCGLTAIKNSGINSLPALSPSGGRRQYVALSNFQYPVVFPSEFSFLPRLFFANLRADSPSDANPRKIRGLRKTLAINSLRSGAILSSCNKHRFSTWYSLFQGMICTITHHETGITTPLNSLYRNAVWTVRHHTMWYAAWPYGPNKPFLCLI